MSKHGKHWIFPAFAVLAVFAAFYVAPAFQTTENATVFLEGCTEETCALHGDLTTNVWTRDYELTQEDGSVVIFPPENVRMMSWPVPGSSTEK